MGYEYRQTPKVPGSPDCFSIGQQRMELDEDTIKNFDLKPALDKIGAALLEQYKGHHTSGGKVVVGFEFHGLTFTYILEREKAKAV